MTSATTQPETEATAAKALPIYDYLAARENCTWTAADSLYVRRVLLQVEEMATALIERARRGA